MNATTLLATNLEGDNDLNRQPIRNSERRGKREQIAEAATAAICEMLQAVSLYPCGCDRLHQVAKGLAASPA